MLRAPLLCLFGLVLLSSKATEAEVDMPLGTLFDQPPASLRRSYLESTGPNRLRVGLVLADQTSGESGGPEALKLFRTLPGTSEIAREAGAEFAAYARGVACGIQIRAGEIGAARGDCQAALDAVESIADPFIRSRIYGTASFEALRSGELEKALNLARLALTEANRSTSDLAKATALNNIGVAQLFTGYHEQALESFEDERSLLGKFGDRSLAKVLDFNLGLAHMEAGHFDEAITAFKNGLEWAEGTQQPHRILIAKTQLARAHLQQGSPEAAITMLAPEVNAVDRNLDPDSHAHAWLVFGRAHIALARFEEALAFIERGLETIANTENSMRRGQLKLGRIEALQGAGRSNQALGEARELVKELRRRKSDELDLALLRLADLEATDGSWESAYRTNLEAQEIETQSRGDRYEVRVAMLREAYELDMAERDRETAQEQDEHQTAISQRNTSLLAGFAAVLGLLILAGSLNRARREQYRIAYQQRRLSEELEGLVAVRTEALELEMAERMRGEEQRLSLEKQVAEADKLRALGQLTGGIAHDFNNLLTVVTSASEMLANEPEMSAADRQELVAAIRRSADSGRDVNQGLLAYARQQPLEPETIDIRDHLERSSRIFERTLGSEMTLTIGSAPAFILADRSTLTTALINLLLNARDASNGRGEVEILVTPQGEGSTILLEVKDNGCGMSHEEVQKAIEPFYSTKLSTISSGLGLSMVHGFVHQSGGDFSIQSSPGAGTTVRISLPGTVAAIAKPLSHTSLTHLPEGLKVLLVDDNQDVRSMMLLMLQNLGQQVRVAESGKVGLELLFEDTPDILVSDVLMPGEMNGIELAGAARTHHPSLPILLVSGYAEAVDLDYPLLSKPFTIQDLEQRLLEILGDQGTRARRSA